MAIQVVRVGRRWPKRYHIRVTPPEGTWSTARSVGKQRLNWRLRKITHPTDFWDLIAVADERYELEGRGRRRCTGVHLDFQVWVDRKLTNPLRFLGNRVRLR
jgi:hypothetical protein